MVRKRRGPSRPKVPSRIPVEAPPLVTQVAEMMELAKPMRGLRQSLLLRHAVPGESGKSGRQEVLGRKRGRRCNPGNTPLELAYLPPGVAGGLKHTSSKKRILFARDGKGIIEHAKSVISRRRRRSGDCSGLPMGGVWSEGSIGTLQQLECSRILRERSSVSCCSYSCSSSSSSFSSAVIQSSQGHFARQSACGTTPATPAEAPLPGVCYIEYPATPDLASACPSLHAPEDFATGYDDYTNGGSHRGRESRSSRSCNSSRSRSRSLSRGSSSSGGGGGSGDGGRGMGIDRDGDGRSRSRSADGHRMVSGGDRPTLRRRPSCPFIEGGFNAQSRDESQRPNCPFIGGTSGQSRGGSRAAGSGLSSRSMGGGSDGGSRSSGGGDGGGGGGGSGGATSGAGTQEQERAEGETEGGRDGSMISQRGSGLHENLPQRRPGEQRAAEEGPSFKYRTSMGRELTQQDGMGNSPPRPSEPKQESAPAKAERRGRGKGWGRGSGAGRKGDVMDAHPLEMKVLPSLPGVDEHQLPSFCLAELHGDIRRNRAALSTPFRDRAIRTRPAAPVLADETNAFDDLGSEGRSCMNTEDENELCVGARYLLAFKAKAGRDGLTLQELESAFRASRRADAFMAIEKKGKAAFVKCLAMLKAHGLSPHAWIEELLSKRKGDSLTTFDMGESIRAYNRAKPSCVRSHKHWLRDFMISEKDLRWCLRFVDPDGNTDVDAEELSNAVRSTLEGKPRIPWEEGRAVALILEFDRFMSANHIRLVDLFEKADKEKGGTLDEEQLREFLKLVKKAAAGEESIQAKERKERSEEQEREKARDDLRQKATKAKERLAHARETGAYDVLSGLKTFTKTKGLRLSDLIKATGAHPDEGMTPAQLETFFERTTNSSGQFTKGSLERIVVFVDEDGDGLLSLHEIQLALAQQTHDELLLRQLAKAVARCMSKKEREGNASSSQRKTDTARGNDRRGGEGVVPTGISRTNAPNDTRTNARNDPRKNPRNDTRNDTWNVSRKGPETTPFGRSVRWDNCESLDASLDGMASSAALSDGLGGRTKLTTSSTCGSSLEPEASTNISAGASTNADENFSVSAGYAGARDSRPAPVIRAVWILEDDSSIDSIALMEGLNVAASMGERRGLYRSESSIPRTAFKVQAGSNLDSSWLPGFDQRFEIQRRRQGQRVVGGSCTWYTN